MPGGFKISSSVKISSNFTIAGSTNATAQAYINQCATLGSPLTAQDQAAVTDLCNGLLTDGLLAVCDRLTWLAAGSTTQALLDINALATSTNVNSSTFAAYGGYTGNGTTSYINSGFVPSTAAGHFTTSSSSFGVYVRTSRAGANMADIGDDSGGNRNHIYPRYSDNNNYTGIQAVDFATASAVTTGFWCASRTGASVQNIYRNGALFGGPSANAEVALSSGNIIIGALQGNADLSTDQCALFWIGGGLTATQALNLYNRIQTFAAQTSTAWNV